MPDDTRNIERACRILGSQTKETFLEVAREMIWVRAAKHGKFPTTVTKPQKKAARKFEDALRRLEFALKNRDLAHDVRDGFPDLKRWRERAKEAASRKLDFMVIRQKADAKLDSAIRAARLLTAHNVPLKLTLKKGNWCELGALLYGEPNAHFLHHCRKAKSHLGQSGFRSGSRKSRLKSN